ncbi:AAEL005889-PA [Aedes aegypti]|uniref:AAEL005889-PA n=1 Tax=Aedes aegypti TaxID=7159 RepID=Q178H2_AEDAE|nr:AAEL005889-PA [Aedes aegypti]
MDPTQDQFRMFIQAASRRSQRSDGSSHYGSQPTPPQIDDSCDEKFKLRESCKCRTCTFKEG